MTHSRADSLLSQRKMQHTWSATGMSTCCQRPWPAAECGGRPPPVAAGQAPALLAQYSPSPPAEQRLEETAGHSQRQTPTALPPVTYIAGWSMHPGCMCQPDD